ncbi:tRNA pseudouridine synthase 3 [Dermatophagoides farinae]|uniref:tRNA pseudouridine synthase 3 n=1 Tax=Dermatophagoides farinae TaxID=6954 RepID=A0A922HS73_DERFA|nr:tRNA pseudouridine(38/39) synthase-like [Dermatophagoides farinae]KAH9506721.1 tRNA pseudouridine synthase 3 [Dermatophagoides farinae]
MDNVDEKQQNLMDLSKEELIAQIHLMKKQNEQLQNTIDKLKNRNQSNHAQQKPQKEFDFSRYKTRHVMLKFLYLGWNYDGFTVQDSLNTIEKVLFEALIKTKLIESRETCNYNRCGRTDKGVSAFCQVISISVRSIMKREPDFDDHMELSDAQEMDYPSILNRVLPHDIRMISWAPVSSNPVISARFDCCRRVYHYYFPRIDLDIDAMNQGCASLIGVHDFRNLCRMDVQNGVTNFVRRVYSASIQPFVDEQDSYSFCLFRIEASAFLWHQIRYIMAVLFLVGQHLESPNIFKELLNIHKHSSRPQYSMASDLPLVLYEAHYDPDKVPIWNQGKDIANTIAQLRSQWMKESIQSTIIKSMIESLINSAGIRLENDTYGGVRKLFGNAARNYKKLLDRPRCSSFEDRLIKTSQKRVKIE